MSSALPVELHGDTLAQNPACAKKAVDVDSIVVLRGLSASLPDEEHFRVLAIVCEAGKNINPLYKPMRPFRETLHITIAGQRWYLLFYHDPLSADIACWKHRARSPESDDKEGMLPHGAYVEELSPDFKTPTDTVIRTILDSGYVVYETPAGRDGRLF